MNPKITMTEETDPVEIAKSKARHEKFERNYAWLESHASKVYSNRGKYVCIAGQQLFVGDDITLVLAQARAAHPEDDGPLFQYVPETRAARIYAHRWSMASM